jgi:hypothetical protein
MSDQVYFAARPPEEVCKFIISRAIEPYYQWLRDTGRLAFWKRIHRQRFSGLFDAGLVGVDGEADELVSMNVNDFANLLQHTISMTTSTRPAFEPKATNTDHRSQVQTILAQGILEYVLKEKRLETLGREALQNALMFAGGYGVLGWNSTAGLDYGVEDQPDGTQKVMRSGDLTFYIADPLGMVSDVTKQSADLHQYRCVRKPVNRFDQAAKYPHLAEKILALPNKYSSSDASMRPIFASLDRYETDDIWLWEFYHERCDSLPDGRLVIFHEPDVLLFDGPLPFRKVPVIELCPEYLPGLPHGYSPLWDLLSLQEASNALFTTIASNQAAFGVQNVAVPRGANIDVQSFGGLKVIEFDPKFGKPEPMNLTQTAPETFTFLNMVRQANETLSGINAVRRGDPQAALGKGASGAAMALLDAKAIEFSSGIQQAWVDFLANIATAVLWIYRDYAKTPQVALIAGKSNRSLMREFTGEDLDLIDRVTVDLGNPVSRTTAGRMQIAQDLLGNGMVKTPQEYLMVLQTGKLEPLVEGETKELLTIREENEALAEGNTPVMALIGQNHPMHIREHLAAVGSPSSQSDPQAVGRVLSHVQEHADLWRNADPLILAACNVPPPPMPALMPVMGGNPPAPAPPNGAAGIPPANPGGPSPGVMQQQPSMPQQPVNPQTGERAPAPMGMA